MPCCSTILTTKRKIILKSKITTFIKENQQSEKELNAIIKSLKQDRLDRFNQQKDDIFHENILSDLIGKEYIYTRSNWCGSFNQGTLEAENIQSGKIHGYLVPHMFGTMKDYQEATHVLTPFGEEGEELFQMLDKEAYYISFFLEDCDEMDFFDEENTLDNQDFKTTRDKEVYEIMMFKIS